VIDTTKPVDRTGNTFCGPLVVAAILGTSTGVVAAELANQRVANKGALSYGKVRRARGYKQGIVKGTHGPECFALLERHGFALEGVDVGMRYRRMRKARGRDTFVNANFTHWNVWPPLFAEDDDWYPATLVEREGLALWRVVVRKVFDSGTYIVQLPGHWAIAHDGKWCETYTRGEWVALRGAPSNRRKVLAAWRVTRAGGFANV
jgi:hypothetical protein